MLTEEWESDFSYRRPPAWRPGQGIKLVYLDQWCWDAIARDRVGDARNASERGIYEFLCEKVDSCEIAIPLSQAHYCENWVRKNEDARWDTAVMMAELSGFTTMTHVGLAQWEAVVAISDYLGTTTRPLRPSILGWGMYHCFTGEDRRAKVVSSGPDRLAVWRSLSLDQFHSLKSIEVEARYRLELAILALREPRLERSGFMTLPPIPGLPDGGSFRDVQIDQAQAITRHGRSKAVVRNTTVFSAFASSESFLASACDELGVSWSTEVDRLAGLDPPSRVDALENMLMSMPLQWVFTELRHRAHMKPEFRWASSDLWDFWALALAMQVADLMVVDRRTYNLITEAALPANRTTVLRRLSDLRNTLS